ncbi:MAG: hypothetical protein ACRDQA_15455, partial [Nocardioidaceae bacterium]
SRSAGLPQIGDDIGNWAEPLGMVAIVAEAITFLAAAGVLAHRSHVLRSRPPGTGSSVIEEAP